MNDVKNVDGGDPYAIPTDNPFFDGGGAAEVSAHGLCNPWRFSIDLETGRLPEIEARYFYADWCGRWVGSFLFVDGAATQPSDWSADSAGAGQVNNFGVDGFGELCIADFDGVGTRSRRSDRPRIGNRGRDPRRPRRVPNNASCGLAGRRTTRSRIRGRVQTDVVQRPPISMMNARFRLILIAVVSLVVTACGSAGGADPTSAPPATDDAGPAAEVFDPGDVVSLDVPRVEVIVSDTDVAAVVAADAAFGFDLFGVTAGDDNLLLSPYSIATALSMLYPGAEGATASEIADVLHLSVDDAALHAVRSHIETLLATAPPPMGDEDTREPFTIRPANSAWGQGGYPFEADYLRILAESYGAGLRVLDYVADPEGSRRIINDWVEETTEDRIQELVPEGSITVDTRLALVNAIWFKANWLEPFDPAATTPGGFTLLDGSRINVPLMHGTLRTAYAGTDLFDAVRLPYAGGAALVVLLPKQGSPADLAAALTPSDLEIPWADHLVDIAMPTFEFESEIGLTSALKELGMRAAFEPPVGDGADLTGITPVRELYVSDAFHKTFIALDEEGTEAAAATAIIVSLESAPQPAIFTADRPFLFWIEHSPTGEMLFLGQVTNPA